MHECVCVYVCVGVDFFILAVDPNFHDTCRLRQEARGFSFPWREKYRGRKRKKEKEKRAERRGTEKEKNNQQFAAFDLFVDSRTVKRRRTAHYHRLKLRKYLDSCRLCQPGYTSSRGLWERPTSSHITPLWRTVSVQEDVWSETSLRFAARKCRLPSLPKGGSRKGCFGCLLDQE